MKFDVSTVIGESITGISILFRCECGWVFADEKIRIAGETVLVQERRAQRLVRRIYATQLVETPVRSELD